ncbi:MAG: phosphate ABC transporter permease family protein, partial [Gammaproteobacteria bacterium]
MTFLQLSFVFLILVATSWVLGWRRIRIPHLAGAIQPRSRAVYHGAYNALWCGLPMLLVVFAWLAVEPWVIQP